MNMKIYGNEQLVELLKKSVLSGRQQRSVMIYGEKGIGKKTLARYIAAQFLCERHDGTPCGKCHACQMLQRGTHPDFIMVKANANGNYLVDEAIRPIVSDAVVLPNESNVKVYVIPDIDMSVNTSVQVQNILLKLIEEPPEHVVMILTARSKEIFLSTIISRVLSLGMVSVTTNESRAYLVENYPDARADEISEAVAAGRGNIGRCEEYLQKGSFYDATIFAKGLAKAVVTGNSYEILKALFTADGKKQLLRQGLVLFSEIVRDACVYRLGDTENELAVSCDYEDSVMLAEKISSVGCVKMYDKLCEYIRRIDANGNLSLTINSLSAELV